MSSLKFDVRCYIEDLKGVFQVELGKKWDPPSLTEEFIDEFLRDGFIVQNGIMCALGNSDAR